MKLFYITIAFVSSQKALTDQVALAESKCSFFMDKALDCDPPKSKIGKYKFRIAKILRDAVHHEKKGKCKGKKSRTRRDDFDDLEADFEKIKDTGIWDISLELFDLTSYPFWRKKWTVMSSRASLKPKLNQVVSCQPDCNVLLNVPFSRW